MNSTICWVADPGVNTFATPSRFSSGILGGDGSADGDEYRVTFGSIAALVLSSLVFGLLRLGNPGPDPGLEHCFSASGRHHS